MVKINDYLNGYVIINISEASATDIANKLFAHGIAFKTLGSNKLIINYKDRNKVKRLLYEYTSISCKSGGTGHIAEKYKSRFGIFVGMALALVMIIMSTQIVWRIEITGNEKLSDAHIAEILLNYGVCEGKLKSKIDLNKLHQEILLDNGNIGWLRVNLRGTAAIVEVMEYTPPELLVSSRGMANLVASEDARILSVDTYSGTPSVKAGDVVKKGDLLISGIVDSNTHGYNLKNAEGAVIGEVLKNIKIEIPYKYLQKKSTGRTYSEKSIIFLGNRLKLFKNSGNIDTSCDIIVKKHRLEIFDTVKLPLEIEETILNEYIEEEISLSREEAFERAGVILEAELKNISKTGDIVSRQVTVEENDNTVILNVTVYHTADISKQMPISGPRYNANVNLSK